VTKPRVFISHSAKEPSAVQALDALDQQLRDAGFTVFLDRHIYPGESWRAEIHTWMGLCHGAVILFSTSAFESNWVKKEATVLSWRNALDTPFQLVPLFVPPASRDALAEGKFGPLALTELEDTTSVDAAVERLQTLQQGRLSAPMDTWVRTLEYVFTQVEQVDPRVIEDAAATVGVDFEWDPALSMGQRLARRMFHVKYDDLAGVISSLSGVLPTGEAQRIADVVEILAPIWVNPLAAAGIPEIVKDGEGLRAISLNASQNWTAEMYIERACCGDSTWMVLESNNVSGEDEEVERISKELFADAQLKLRWDGTLEELLVWIDGYAKNKGKFFAIVPNASTLSDDVIAELQQRFRSFTFVFWDQERPPPRFIDASHAVILVPELTEQEERAARDTYQWLRALIPAGS
jgi:hypothetical protein